MKEGFLLLQACFSQFCNPCDISDVNGEHASGTMKQDSDLNTDLTHGSSSDTDAVEVCDKLKAWYQPAKRNSSLTALEQPADINVVGVLPNVSACITHWANKNRTKNQGGTAFWF